MQCIQLSIINYIWMNYSMYNSKYNIMYKSTYNMCGWERKRDKETEREKKREREKPCRVTSISVASSATKRKDLTLVLEPTWWKEKADYYKLISVLRVCAMLCRHRHPHTQNRCININKRLNYVFALSTFSSYKLFLQKKSPCLSFCAK